MNQPSGAIIEVGYTIADTETGEVKLSKGLIVNAHEQLTDFIKGLTHISQEMVDNGQELVDAWKELLKDCETLGAHRQPVIWGGGDMRVLKQQVGAKAPSLLITDKTRWAFGYTEMNIKNIVQAILNAKGYKSQGGLAKSLGKFDLSFKGTKHRAVDDSLNTFLLYYELLNRLKVIDVKAKG
jgi:inhibitor of KinA sporulation pathway (predicted exonuclease)